MDGPNVGHAHTAVSEDLSRITRRYEGLIRDLSVLAELDDCDRPDIEINEKLTPPISSGVIPNAVSVSIAWPTEMVWPAAGTTRGEVEGRDNRRLGAPAPNGIKPLTTR